MVTSQFVVREHPAKTLTWWYQRRSQIDMQPTFQRQGGLWSNRDKAFLIDSILNGYDIPKLYLADFSFGGTALQSGNSLYAIIDGRQRLEAIYGFFEDRVALNEDFVWDPDVSLPLAKKRYGEIRSSFPHVASIFEEFNLSVMSVWTDDASKINQLFIRLNRNKPLTGPEVRNAVSGRVADAIRAVTGLPFFSNQIGFTTKRGSDKNLAAKLLLIEFSGDFVNTKKRDLDRFANVAISDAEAEGAALDAAADRVRNVVELLSIVFNSKDVLLKSAGLIPVYYWLVREQGIEQVRAFLLFWTELTKSLPKELTRMGQSIDVLLSERLGVFNLAKRNVNDAFAMRPLYGVLAAELRRYRAGLHESTESYVKSISLARAKNRT